MSEHQFPGMNLHPLDSVALDGQFWLLWGDGAMAVAQWTDKGWRYASGRPLEFVPQLYQPK